MVAVPGCFDFIALPRRVRTFLFVGANGIRPLRYPTVLTLMCNAIKALSIVLTEHLKPHLSPRCYHLAGNGGLKGAVREVAAHLPEQKFVFRTDVKGYYASINHDILLGLLREYVSDEAVIDLVRQYLQRFVSDGGDYTDIEKGISLGCPLSPLMGALFLKPLDDRMAELGCIYVRFMDDWCVLAPTRWKLRKAIRATNEVMEQLLVLKHPDKTAIGRIAKGFEFLGYCFSTEGLQVAKKTVDRMLDKVCRLQEQGATVERICDYVRRWVSWAIGSGNLNCRTTQSHLHNLCRSLDPYVYYPHGPTQFSYR